MGRWQRLLPAVLSVIAGGTDAISLLGLGLFTAHITGNLALLAVHFGTGRPASPALLLSLPVFVLVVGFTKLISSRPAVTAPVRLRRLLLAQLLLFGGFLAAGLAAGADPDPHTPLATVAALLGVSAMAVQNSLVQLALVGVPPTTVMTTNLTRLTLDTGDLLRRPDPATVSRAGQRAGRTWPVLAGFVAGAALGGAAYAVVGLLAVVLPAGLALLALLLGVDRSG